MKHLNELYKEVHDCHHNYEGKLSYKNLAITMLHAAHNIEIDFFGEGGHFSDPIVNAFWEEMEENWADLPTQLERMNIAKALRWGARAFNGTEAWLEAIRELDDQYMANDKERIACMSEVYK